VPINTVGVHHIRLRRATGRAHGSSSSQLRTPQRQRGGSGTAGNIFSAMLANNSSNTADSDSISTDPYAPAPWIVLVAEVAVAGDGALRVTVRSRLSITNHSGVPLELCLYSPVPSSYSNTTNTGSGPTSPAINTNSSSSSGAISSPPLPLRQDTVLAAGACMHVPLALITPQLKVLSRPLDGSVKWGPVVQSLREIDTRAARGKHRDTDNVFAVCAPEGRGSHNSSSSARRGTQSASQQSIAAADWCLHGEIVCERSSTSGTDNRCATEDDYTTDANDDMNNDGTSGTDTAAYNRSGESPASERSSSSPATAASMLRQAKGAFSEFADLFDISSTSPSKVAVPLAAPTVSPLFTVPEQSIEPGYPTEDAPTVSTSNSTQQQRQRASDYAAHEAAPNCGDELNTAATSTTASGATTTTASTAAAWQSVQVPQTRGSRCFRLQRGQTGGRGTSDGFVDVPDTDTEVLQQGLKSLFAVGNSSTDWSGIDKLRLLQQSGSSSASTGLMPLAVTLQAPLQLHNLLCQPLAYRLVSR
jgi:hypothetical protein